MSKIHDYIKLVKKLRAARREMFENAEKITSYQHEYQLNTLEDIEVETCINKFTRVSSDVSADMCVDGGYIKYCTLFGNLPCENRKCPHFPGNLDYIVAKEKYDDALFARRKFLRNLCKKRTR